MIVVEIFALPLLIVKMKTIFLCLQFQMTRLEHLCVQYLVACIGHRNVLAALQNAARLKLDYIKVGARTRNIQSYIYGKSL